MRALVVVLAGLLAAVGAVAEVGAAGAAAAAEESGGLLLRQGDRVVFYGDSITQQMLYTRYVQQYVYVRHPELDVRFFNAGWGGDTARGANARLERDVLFLEPTVVTLCFGMNDGRYRSKDDGVVRAYEDELDRLAATLVARGVRVLVASPGCVDTDRREPLAKAGYNDTLAALRDAAQRVAERRGCRFVDLHTPMLRVQQELKRRDPAFTMIPDAVHPSAPGHVVMAKAILHGLGVTRLPDLGELDVRVKGGGLRVVADGPQGIVAEGAAPLPFWIDPAALDAARACGLVEDLVGQRLAVRGLAAGRYELTLDGTAVGSYDAAELAAGVVLTGEWSEAGRRVHDDVARKEARYYAAWREFRVPNEERAAREAHVRDIVAKDLELDALLHEWIRGEAAPGGAPLRIVVQGAPEGPNLALGRDYECSDPNRAGWGAGGLTDGSWDPTAQDCFATGDADAFPKHVTVDLGKTLRVGAVRLGVPPFGATRTVHVELSRNGKSFSRVATCTFEPRKAERRTVTFEPAAAHHVRLVYEDHHADGAGYPPTFCFTTELEVYAPAH